MQISVEVIFEKMFKSRSFLKYVLRPPPLALQDVFAALIKMFCVQSGGINKHRWLRASSSVCPANGGLSVEPESKGEH